ncbi:DUF1501 domain-containing protein [Tuwongella immobilis]|uniref:DUF1501 domain-containing protein n=1 Tax=Tuwongella immobilis TaxID=692036 RepID=A0A6C2YQ19_9BACT|nr:DUF1501 domain-containing protein [Tuwongella immobilis]VIP03566.1 arylsulfatase a family protein : Uncharacterized protein OS=Planctomyces maris DSM 8797 GN=PM8797T_01099 PE=4 SV=1: DUF1501 [Tuwongella immobilis]VTS04500.1 arylsulfatase a family protein : Uncharacterized protein OS=Planctomyces maris DSM 8797 GN=PM8797T_01099 PE=4 SV=1: DUF1501 [Tuwongella immobilis]
MWNPLGPARRTCEGLTRRDWLQVGSLACFGMSLPKLLAAESASSSKPGRVKSVILLFLFGGPSQLETWDMKPDAPEKIRGPFRPIPSRTPGLRICEHLPKMAAMSDQFSVIRTNTHRYNDHSGAGHYLQTGHVWHVPIGGGFSPTPKDWPSIGSVVEYLAQQRSLNRPMPDYFVLPNSLGQLQQAGQFPRPGEHAGWLGQRYNPLTTRIGKRSLTDNPYWRNCTDDELNFQIPGMTPRAELNGPRLQDRQSLLSAFDAMQQQVDDAKPHNLDIFRQRALSLITSAQTRSALDIRREPSQLRDRYGRHLFGQSCLMARRLVEAGVRFVTVHYDCVDGYSWDSHQNSADVKSHLLPTFDQAYSALITDLKDRGLLDETLVLATGEMGRTPQANANWGRNHWSTLFSNIWAGGGIPGGQLHGKSDKDAAYALEKPVSPEDLAATLYDALGIDPEIRVLNRENRPTNLIEGGTPLRSLWGSDSDRG